KQQQFHSDLAKQLFKPKKQRNGPLLQQVVAAVEAVPDTADTDTAKHTCFTTAPQLSTSSSLYLSFATPRAQCKTTTTPGPCLSLALSKHSWRDNLSPKAQHINP